MLNKNNFLKTQKQNRIEEGATYAHIIFSNALTLKTFINNFIIFAAITNELKYERSYNAQDFGNQIYNST